MSNAAQYKDPCPLRGFWSLLNGTLFCSSQIWSVNTCILSCHLDASESIDLATLHECIVDHGTVKQFTHKRITANDRRLSCKQKTKNPLVHQVLEKKLFYPYCLPFRFVLTVVSPSTECTSIYIIIIILFSLCLSSVSM